MGGLCCCQVSLPPPPTIPASSSSFCGFYFYFYFFFPLSPSYFDCFFLLLPLSAQEKDRGAYGESERRVSCCLASFARRISRRKRSFLVLLCWSLNCLQTNCPDSDGAIAGCQNGLTLTSFRVELDVLQLLALPIYPHAYMYVYKQLVCVGPRHISSFFYALDRTHHDNRLKDVTTELKEFSSRFTPTGKKKEEGEKRHIYVYQSS